MDPALQGFREVDGIDQLPIAAKLIAVGREDQAREMRQFRLVPLLRQRPGLNDFALTKQTRKPLI